MTHTVRKAIPKCPTNIPIMLHFRFVLELNNPAMKQTSESTDEAKQKTKPKSSISVNPQVMFPKSQ